MQALRASLGHGAFALTGEQGLGCAEPEAAELELGQPGVGEQRDLAGSDGDDDGDRIGEQAPSREQHGLGGSFVQPLGVVEKHAERLLLGRGGEDSQGRGADHEPLASHGRPEREGRPQCGGLWRRQAVDVREHGAQELEQSGERDRSFLLDSARSENAHLAGARRGVGQQRALADAGLAADHERSARADARVGEQTLDRCALRIAPEHDPSMTQALRACGPGGPPDVTAALAP